MRHLIIELTHEEQAELIRIRDQHALAYVRERAAAILKVAAGQQGQEVAARGLLKERHRTTVSGWVHQYKREGVKGLVVKPGRGRKPSFSPSASD